MVSAGFTIMPDLPKTLPTPWSISKLEGAPPESDQESVADSPFIMVFGLALKFEITGTGGLTVTVTDFVAVPEIFVAVRV